MSPLTTPSLPTTAEVKSASWVVVATTLISSCELGAPAVLHPVSAKAIAPKAAATAAARDRENRMVES